MLTFDADGQHNTKDINKIFKKLIIDKNMLVVGERVKKQRILEYLFSIYTNKFFKIDDPLSGLKAINLKNIRSKINNSPFSYSGTHILLQCIIKNLKHGTIKININKRNGKSRYGNIFLQTLKYLDHYYILFIKI